MEFQGGGGLAKAIVFKEMYGAILEFPQGWERWGMGGANHKKAGEVWIIPGTTR